MALSNDLISQFAQITKTDVERKTERTVYGTVVENNGKNYVRFDGSDLLTPVISTVDTSDGDRVAVLLKNHSATITGNISAPAAKREVVNLVVTRVTDTETVLADVVTTKTLDAQVARIDTLTTAYLTVNETIYAHNARISSLEADNVTITGNVSANTANIGTLTASNADIIGRLSAVEGIVGNLEVGNLDTATLRATYATIDFANVTMASIGNLYTKSGIIKDLVVSDTSITGELNGVVINGDLIKANTLIANKIIFTGEDGLYYSLNNKGVTVEDEQTVYNSLNGSVILAKSITATKISVDDLVAFGATIGGFNISENSIYSGVKNSVSANSPGIYLDKDGQVLFGDSKNYVKYYKDGEAYKLVIASDELTTKITNAGKTATDYMNLSSAGLVVGQNPSNPTAGNTLISADGVTIRSGTTNLAAFKAANRTASGISSATITSTDSTDSESDGITNVKGTLTSGGTRANVYITTNGNPVYFPNGIETNKVLINDKSGIIANANIVLNGSLVDKSGEGILTPLNSYGNMVIGYGRYQDGGGTYVYGTRVKAKTKEGFFASVNGHAAIETDNDSGNATFGWHHYNAKAGETNVYGNIVSLVSRDDIRINAGGNAIRANGSIVPYDAGLYNLGAASLSFQNIYINGKNTGSMHGIRYSNANDETVNAFGINANGWPVFGNSTYCTNIICKSTTTSSTGYSFKITCGDNPALTIGDSDARLLLFGGTDSTSRYIGSVAAYKRTYTSTANMVITDNSIIGRVTSSSRRYKKDIADLPLEVVKGLYDMPVRQYKYREDYVSADDQRYETDIPGFIAEEVAEYFPIACDQIKASDGSYIPEVWNSHIIVPALLKLIQDLNDRVRTLERKDA